MMDKIERLAFRRLLEKALYDLNQAHDYATDRDEWHRAKFIQNSIDQLNSLLHIESITKLEAK